MALFEICNRLGIFYLIFLLRWRASLRVKEIAEKWFNVRGMKDEDIRYNGY